VTWLVGVYAALLLFQPTTAAAQVEPAQEAAPPLVRVLSIQEVVREGRLLSLTASEVVLLTDGIALTLPLDEVRRINRVTHGARIGFLAGTLAGLAVTAGSCTSSGNPASAGRCQASHLSGLALPSG
jgi:hypothetical protein